MIQFCLIVQTGPWLYNKQHGTPVELLEKGAHGSHRPTIVVRWLLLHTCSYHTRAGMCEQSTDV